MPDDLCENCGHLKTIHMNGTDVCSAHGCDCQAFVQPEITDDEHSDEVARRAAEMLDNEAFVLAVDSIVRRVIGERDTRFDLALCVDQEMEAELERNWGRDDPLNPFGLLESLKAERPGAWVSPGMSLRMFVAVERVAREAFNEATRGG